jgi:hypothetical protein
MVLSWIAVGAFLGNGINNMAECHAAIAFVRKALEQVTDEIELGMDFR